MKARDVAPRGQTIVEFALTLPILLMLVIGIFDLGRVVWANDTLAAAAREAARFAIVHGGSELNDCPVGPPTRSAASRMYDPDVCPYPSPSRQGVKEVAQNWLIAVSSPVTISVCYGQVDTCAGDVDGPGPNGRPDPADNRRGTPVTVTITSQVDLAASGLLGIGPIDLAATSTMIINR